MAFKRRKTRQLLLGGVAIGGRAPVSIQSMTTTFTRDAAATIAQIQRLEEAGCEIVRVAVFNGEDARAIRAIRRAVRVPLVADIHFDYRLALKALASGIDGLRLNPGNIGARERVRAVVAAARERQVPIRIGVNSGSVEKAVLDRFGGVTAEALVESAMGHVRLLEDLDYPNLKVSLKASNPLVTVAANRLFARRTDYPLHLGVTEAGPAVSGAIKSATALSLLLSKGIGDTIRISLTADPVEEVYAARALLEALELRRFGLKVVSCPTCGRCQVPDLIAIAGRVERRFRHVRAPLTVAVMGCAVNGPGEAREADIGVACAKERALLFRRGEKVGWIDLGRIEAVIEAEIGGLLGDDGKKPRLIG